MLPTEVFDLPDEYFAFRSYYEAVACMFWTIDIPLNFSTGFISKEGLLEMRKDVVMEHYMRTWAIPDILITAFCWISLVEHISGSSMLRLTKTGSCCLRAARLLRLHWVKGKLGHLAHDVSSEAITTVLGIVKLLLLLILVTHYVACMWRMLAMDSDEPETWRGKFLESSPGQHYDYLISMHWAL